MDGSERHGGYGRGRGGFGGGDRGGPKPVKVGDVLDVSIEAVAAKGDGIAKKDGFVIFVPGAKVGDTIKVKITDVRMKFAIAAREDEGSAPSEEAASEEQPAESSEEAPSEESA